MRGECHPGATRVGVRAMRPGRAPPGRDNSSKEPDQEESRLRDFRRAPKKDTTRLNEQIRVPMIRVIGSDGEQLGVLATEDALTRAQDEGFDLVEVAPGSDPPVCRIMDYGRYRYEQQKKKKAGRSKGHAAALKEVKLRPRTDDHDLETKLKNARRFLLDGDKVKVTVMYRGREMVHRQLGRKQLDRVVEMLGILATVENPPRMEGRFLSMILVPNREGVAEARKFIDAQEKEAVAD